MKVLIWIGCFFVATILNTILGYATGVKVGYLIFYFAVYFVAKKLCNKWDKYIEIKTGKKKTKIAEMDKIRFCRRCGATLLENSKFCRKCGTEIVDELEITLGENCKYCKKCGADVTEDNDICHVCGEKKADV